MSGLTEPSVFVPTTVLLASLLGSAHCAGMCGPLLLSVSRRSGDSVKYHLGRLLSYALLGAVAGAMGQVFLHSPIFRWLPWASGILMALLFAMMGVQLWLGRAPHVSIVPRGLMSRLYRLANGRVFVIGALSALLPCGWLQTYVLAAATTQNAIWGALLMTVFWLGTLPALTTISFIGKRSWGNLLLKQRRIAAFLLVAIGMSGITLKLVQVVAHHNSCHGP